jgi:hypothetical protein
VICAVTSAIAGVIAALPWVGIADYRALVHPRVPLPAPPPRVSSTLQIITASYAENRLGPTGNMTSAMRAECDGKESCNFTVDWKGDDPARFQIKNLHAVYTCSPSTKPLDLWEGGDVSEGHSAVAREMMGQVVHLECPQQK